MGVFNESLRRISAALIQTVNSLFFPVRGLWLLCIGVQYIANMVMGQSR